MKTISIPFLPSLREPEAKVIAEDFLKKNGVNLTNGKLPIDIETLSHRIGHPVEHFSDLKANFGCKGTAYNNLTKSRLEIYIDAEHDMTEPSSSRFTIAEELAHIIVHKPIFAQVHTPEDRITLETNTKETTRLVIEKQAKCVASELLLPTCLFHPYLIEWTKNNLKLIIDDRPANSDDLATFMARKISGELGLSEFILKRAILRNAGTDVLDEITKKFDIKYLKDIPRNQTHDISNAFKARRSKK